MRKIYAAEGISGLWRSTVPSAVLAINPAIQFMVYEALKRRLQMVFQSQVIIIYHACNTVVFLLCIPIVTYANGSCRAGGVSLTFCLSVCLT